MLGNFILKLFAVHKADAINAVVVVEMESVMVCDLYNTVLDMDEKFTSAFSSKRYKKKMSELWKGEGE